MCWQRLILLLAALEILGVGLVYLIRPDILMAANGMVMRTIDDAHLVRAAYGGLFVAFGSLFLAGGLKPSLERIALFALMTFMGGFALGRIVSIAVDGQPNVTFFAALASEILLGAAAAGALSAGRAGQAPRSL